MTAGSDWQRIMPSIDRRLTKQKRSGSQRSPVPPSPRLRFHAPREPHPYDPARAKQLLKEAGYPNGFDAGEIHAEPAILSLRRSNGDFLTAIGIKVKMRTMERAAFFTSWREKKLNNLILGSAVPSAMPRRVLRHLPSPAGVMPTAAMPTSMRSSPNNQSSAIASGRTCSIRSNV